LSLLRTEKWLIQDQEMDQQAGQEQEQVSTVTSIIEPSAGDKRPREDDDEQPETQAPGMRASSAQPQQQSHGQIAVPSHKNGGGYSSGEQMNGVGMEYDALYIGDLQWVRLSSGLACYGYCSKLSFCNALLHFVSTVDDRRRSAAGCPECWRQS
jgi:hypothetical protein